MARVESRGRIRALQAVYAWDMRDKSDLPTIASRMWDDLGVEPDELRVGLRSLGSLAGSAITDMQVRGGWGGATRGAAR